MDRRHDPAEHDRLVQRRQTIVQMFQHGAHTPFAARDSPAQRHVRRQRQSAEGVSDRPLQQGNPPATAFAAAESRHLLMADSTMADSTMADSPGAELIGTLRGPSVARLRPSASGLAKRPEVYPPGRRVPDERRCGAIAVRWRSPSTRNVQRPAPAARPAAVTVTRRGLLLALGAPLVLAACDSAGSGAAGSTSSGGVPGTVRSGSGASTTPPARPATAPSPSDTAGALPTRGPDGARVFNIVAHPDDDLLFLSPDLIRSIRGGAQVRTVFVTAGDAGRAAAYWQGRLQGIRAAYAQLAGVPSGWTASGSGLPGVDVEVLAAQPLVSMVFLKLPDGGPGNGYRRYGNASLPKLWRGTLAAITAVDGSARYTRGDLVDALGTLMTGFGPDVVRTQDFVGRFGDGDHNDHHATAYLSRAASRGYRTAHRLVAYQDYATEHRAPDVPADLLAVKRAAFATYSRQDVGVFTRDTPSAGYQPSFAAWLSRQYVLTVE
jgi:LmbE family N-acetylglucosaminyl deacetylase